MTASKPDDMRDNERLRELRLSSGKQYPNEPEIEEPHVAPKGRRGMKGLVIYLSPAAKASLVRIAERERRTMQELGSEALNLLFTKRGEKPIA